ncbi:sulfurtransferase TusA family protein [Pseudomonas sp. HK3]
MVSQSFDMLLDVSGLRCPMPLLKTKQALSSMSSGQVVKVVCTDAGSWRDIPAFVELTSHALLSLKHSDEQFIFMIQKGE